MALLLRKLNDIKRWCEDDASRAGWIRAGEVPADCLADLKTKDNRLSFWLVREKPSNLEEIAVAMTANQLSRSVSVFHYAIIDSEALRLSGMEVKEAPGDTLYTRAVPWHRDLTDLSGSKLLKIANLIFIAPKKFIWDDDIARLLGKAVDEGEVDKGKLHTDLLKNLKKQRDWRSHTSGM